MKLCLLILTTFCVTAHAQPTYTDADIEPLVDDMLPVIEDDEDPEGWYEQLVQAIAHRIDLNKADRATLESLNLLSDQQIESFLTYRATAGPLIDIHELQVIPDWDVNLIASLLPFVAIRDPYALGHSPGHSYWLLRIERNLQVRKNDFAGSPYKSVLRFRSALPGEFSFGLTGEKDAGEPMLFRPSDRQYGFDYLSAHAQLSGKGRLVNLVVGDFQAQFGQGLVLGAGMRTGKGSDRVASLRRTNTGFLPYTAASENTGRRGIALTIKGPTHIRLSAFISEVRRDGRLSGDGDNLYVTSLPSNGYHRTPAERATRKTVRERSAGWIIDYDRKNINAGLVTHAIAFDVPVYPRRSLYNQFAFNGQKSLQHSVYYTWRLHNLSFFGETAMSENGGSGTLAGLLISLRRNLETAVLWRNYSPDYHSFHNNAFAESTRPVNERGVYWGWRYQFNRRLVVNSYVDLFQFPWLGFRRYAPSAGREWMFRLQYAPTREISLRGQFRSETKHRNSAQSDVLYRLAEVTKRNLTLQADYAATQRIRLKTRVLVNTFTSNGTTRGVALVQDISVALPPLRITARHALFEADTYDNRHYVYENDAWLAYSFPVYDGTGVRNYIMIQSRISRYWAIWLRYARTWAPNSRLTAAASDEIEEKRQEDVKFQIRMTF